MVHFNCFLNSSVYWHDDVSFELSLHISQSVNLVFFQTEQIFIQLDELNELDRITPAWKEFNYSLTETQKTF